MAEVSGKQGSFQQGDRQDLERVSGRRPLLILSGRGGGVSENVDLTAGEARLSSKQIFPLNIPDINTAVPKKSPRGIVCALTAMISLLPLFIMSHSFLTNPFPVPGMGEGEREVPKFEDGIVERLRTLKPLAVENSGQEYLSLRFRYVIVKNWVVTALAGEYH